MKRRRVARWLVVVLAVLVCVVVVAMLRRPIALMAPPVAVRAYLLRQLPIGTDKNTVLAFAQENGVTVSADVRTTDVRFVRLHLGAYRLVFRTDVVAFVKLDRSDRVTGIEVQKHTDSL